jgi:Rrf2 family protein
VLSQTADYALRATLYLARHHGGGRVCADEVADATGVPRSYLNKILNTLVRAGLASSTRGPTGGFTLTVAPDELPVARVVDCFDATESRGQCLMAARPCNPAEPCVAHRRWSALHSARRAPLLDTTIADLLGRPLSLAP